jgi:hypothetical protein
VFLLIFVIQLFIYGIHELAEANVFPYSAPLHAATEPYGRMASTAITSRTSWC